MDSSASISEARRTEFRLLKPMPSRHDPAAAEATALREQPWDTQIRRLFPPRDTPASGLPAVAGIRLGHFEIEERIARGGMGTVFRACDLRLDRVVALKVLSQEQLRDPAAIQRFENEARAAAKLDHENIARVYFIGEDRGVHFIAFEYVRGTTVREAIAAKGQLTQDEAVNYTLQAAEALRHTELAGVVHRDIKPSNLIVTPSGRVKLVDLGLARHVSPTDEHDLTVTGTTLGTFDYISPEQARDPRNVDIRSDIYSLGCTLYQMLTGSPPYPNGSSVDKLLLHSAGRPPDPCELNPRIAPRLALVVQRMMASNPDERYPTPQALIDELVDLAEVLGLRATAPDGTIWRKPLYQTEATWWELNRGWALAFAAILLIATVGNNVYQWALSLGAPRDLVGNDRLITEIAPDRATTDNRPTASVASDAAIASESNATTTTVASANPPAGEDAAVNPAPAVAERPADTEQSQNTLSQPTPIPAGNVGLLAQGAARASAIPSPTALIGTRGPEASVPVVPAGERGSTSSSNGSRAVATETAADKSPFVVLGSDGAPVGRFQTLEAACHVAQSGAVIEIHQSGAVRTPQRPILIQGKRLTIRPAAGLRSGLTFIPGDNALTAKSLRLIDVVDGSVELYDVDLSLQVTNNTYADEWVLLSLTRSPEAVLQRVTMTIDNAGWRPAVMIERRMPSDAPSTIMPAVESLRDSEIQIRDCLFRGRAAFFVDRTLEPAVLRISDTAVGVTDEIIRIEGADRAEMDGMPRPLASLRIELDHATAVTQASFIRLWTESVRDAPEIRVDCRNSILDASANGNPFVLLEGHQDSDFLLQRVHWFGSRNVLVHAGEPGCLVRGLWPLTGDEWSYSLGQWQAQWQADWEISSEAIVSESVLSWDPQAATAYSAMQLNDFALRPMANAEVLNPAQGSAGDNSDRGFRPSLSRLPPELSTSNL